MGDRTNPAKENISHHTGFGPIKIINQAAGSILQNENFDFILASGDDITDEDVFRVLPETAYTIRIGVKPSFAGYNIKDFPILLKLLKTITE